ncbi:probable DNA-directed RNA polymerase subunit delta [Clostridium sp. CAG:1000]|jgi:DNA-directed RNA polymerase delta subunit|nr:probable DNA-directed RNA polymerase subunit delta [Clostridium sp. CAG:1000]
MSLRRTKNKMKFKSVTKEELETMSFDDIAYIILKEKGKKMKINDIFKIICDTLCLGDSAFENQIGDFFTLLATEKRFIQLEKGYWDLRENHTSEVDISALEDEEDDIIVEDEKDDVYEESTNYYDDIDEMDDDKSDDDLKDLVIVDENYDDESEM